MSNQDAISQQRADNQLARDSEEALHYIPDNDGYRRLSGKMTGFVLGLLFAMSVYHFYVAGFGIVRELTHRSVHIGFVLVLVFLIFKPTKRNLNLLERFPFLKYFIIGGVPITDILLGGVSLVALGHLLLLPPEILATRVGNPNGIDIIMGTILVVMVLEATRRSVGWGLMVICLLFIAYALFGQFAPSVLKHTGSSWLGLMNHLYLTNQGIYGVAIGVVAKYVFLFVLFGVFATEVGLGQLFMDIAQSVAGRFAGGPAKVAIFSSALLGMISGSSIANTVTTGTLTIPAMKKVGYPPHFAGAVEATSSTGGQITPPIMGAAAFVMVEFLQIPYKSILLAAMVPALLHYFGIFTMVHLEARRLGLRGLRLDEMPLLLKVLQRRWLAALPLIVLISLIFLGRTPDFAVVWGITTCILVGLLDPYRRLTLDRFIHVTTLGAKYALAVGAASAAVGIIVGVVTLTGTGFRLSFMITQGSAGIADWVETLWLGQFFTLYGVTLFFTLIFTAFACILMGAGVPTTATYIILAAIAAPALGLLNIEPLVAHFFVFYYGVLADITPPVALAAYAGAGIAGANPFKTGNTAFRLGIAKALVPFMFVYSPSLLLVVQDFSWLEFFLTLISAICGIGLLAAAFTGFALTWLNKYQRWWLALCAIIFVAPGFKSLIVGVIFSSPIILMQILKVREANLIK